MPNACAFNREYYPEFPAKLKPLTKTKMADASKTPIKICTSVRILTRDTAPLMLLTDLCTLAPCHISDVPGCCLVWYKNSTLLGALQKQANVMCVHLFVQSLRKNNVHVKLWVEESSLIFELSSRRTYSHCLKRLGYSYYSGRRKGILSEKHKRQLLQCAQR